jgi:alpha-L-rhamnosidase
MFGGGITWFYNKLAGMYPDPEQPGYRHITFKPQPAGDLNYTSYSNLTPYGDATVSWNKEQGRFLMNISVPVGCTSTVYLPAGKQGKVLENGRRIKRSQGITFLGTVEGYNIFKVLSGNYRFESGL